MRFPSAALHENLPFGRHSRRLFGALSGTRFARPPWSPHPLLAALVGALTASLRSLPLRSPTGASGGPAALRADRAPTTAASLRFGADDGRRATASEPLRSLLGSDPEMAPAHFWRAATSGRAANSAFARYIKCVSTVRADRPAKSLLAGLLHV